VVETFHFTYAGHRWLRSFRTGASWDTEPIGRWGDGISLVGRHDKPGHLHFTFRPLRFNADPGPVLYSVWPSEPPIREVIDPSASVLSFELTPDGTAVAVLRRPGPAGTNTLHLARRVAAQWKYELLPEYLGQVFGDFAIGPDGQMFFVTWNTETRELLLHRRHADRWLTEIVAATLETEPSMFVLRIDSHGRPVVIVGRLNTGRGDLLRVYRQQPN
jgi:hypothetical protein